MYQLALSCGESLNGVEEAKIDRFGVQLVDTLLSGKEDPYRIANNLVLYLKPRKYARGYMALILSNVKLFFKINRVDIVDEEWRAKVEVPPAVREKDKGTLTLDAVKILIADSDLEYKTLYEIMACGGSRVAESIIIRMKDIFFKPEIPGIPLVRLRKTKTGLSRDFPISQECYGLVQKLSHKTGEWPLFEHLAPLNPKAASHHCERQLIRLGLTRKVEWLNGNGKEAYNITIHNFRQFAENNIVKHWGDFEAPDVAKWLVGRKSGLGSRSAYQTIEDIAPRWKQWIEPHTRFL